MGTTSYKPRQVGGCSKRGHEFSVSINGRELLHWLCDYKLQKKKQSSMELVFYNILIQYF
jgi:hypothetical protein